MCVYNCHFAVQQKLTQHCESRGRSQDGGGIGRVITFSSTNSLKEQQNGEQSLQNIVNQLHFNKKKEKKTVSIYYQPCSFLTPAFQTCSCLHLTH